jgi:hypothetical protein
VFVEFIDDLEETLLKELVAGELVGLDLELAGHDGGEFVDEDVVAFELLILTLLNVMVHSGVE